MALFQTSVLKKYLAQQDETAVDKAYRKYSKYFLNPEVQENIRSSKEEQFQATFLTELFVNVLDYTINPSPKYNLTTEYKNEKNNRKADGAILHNELTVAVVELKGTNTKDLESIRRQAFDYKVNHKGCRFVITSNFEKLRFYINDATDHEEFDLFQLTLKDFALLYLCLQKDNLLKAVPLKIKQDSLVKEEQITKDFYKDYSQFKRELYRDLVKRNKKKLKTTLQSDVNITDDLEHLNDLERLEKNIKLTLFKKSQKLIDRFLFIFFAEDRDLLEYNYTKKLLEDWQNVRKLDIDEPLYDRFKKHFSYLDQGRKNENGRSEIFAYNGGLFKPDPILDNLEIDDNLLYNHTYTLSTYDFESQVDVNILGHIFENSLNEIESITAEIVDGEFDKQKSKRKKDGVFYTPKYITKYIVENTIGKLCEEKKAELGFREEEYFKGRKNRKGFFLQKLVDILDTYRDWLLQITICDPACGSGAFLNQALDFLIKEHQYIDELKAKVLGGGLQFPDIENTILENNIYGVDLNEESVEIAKLSLWLRTAQPRRKLNDLSNNIKCGNSLIDSKAIAGDKAFHWENAFAKVFTNGGFDVVIGNPPYGDYFSEKEKIYLLKRYRGSFSGTFDMYIFFFEVALDILKNAGKLCYITPNTFIDYSQFSGLRDLLKAGNNIEQVIGLTNVFEDAIVDTAIISLEKNKNQSSSFLGDIIKTKLLSLDNTELPAISSTNLFSKGFVIRETKDLDVLKIITDCTYKLSDKIKITQGITTGGNLAFLNTEKHFTDAKISPEYIHKVLKGKTINRYQILFDDEYILYSTKETNEQDQKKIENLLIPFEEKLSTKRETKSGKLPWYCLHWSRDENDFNEPKILIRQTASEIIGVLDVSNYYPIDTIHTLNLIDKSDNNVNDLKFILGLLNSIFFKFLYNWKLDEAGKVYPQIKKVNIEWIPLPNYTITEVDCMANLVSAVQILIEDLNKLKSQFKRYLISKIQIVKIPSNMENWQKIDSTEFIIELNKAIKTSNKQREKENQKLINILTKTDEFEWLDLFEKNKKKAQELQSQIDSIEQQIDAMAYELYGLSEDEIRIVENG